MRSRNSIGSATELAGENAEEAFIDQTLEAENGVRRLSS